MGILIDCLIFCILFIPLNRGMSFWINLILYVIGFIAKALILYGTITFSGVIIYCIMGVVMVWFLRKIIDALNPLTFMFIAILSQEVISLIPAMIGLLK